MTWAFFSKETMSAKQISLMKRYESLVIGTFAVSFLVIFIGVVINVTPANFVPDPQEKASQEEAAQAQSETPPVPEKTAEIDIPAKPTAYEKTFLTDTIRTCSLKNWGVAFKCDLKWNVSEDDEPGKMDVIIFEDPLVTVGWKKFDKNVLYLSQLNRFFFEKLGLYEDGFSLENVRFADHDAVLVKGFSADTPDTQRRDYFYLHNEKMVSIFFTLSPKEKWEGGKSLIQEVKNSF